MVAPFETNHSRGTGRLVFGPRGAALPDSDCASLPCLKLTSTKRRSSRPSSRDGESWSVPFREALTVYREYSVDFSRSETRFSRRQRSRWVLESLSRASSLFRSSRRRNTISSFEEGGGSTRWRRRRRPELPIDSIRSTFFNAFNSSRNSSMIFSLVFSSLSYSERTSVASTSSSLRRRSAFRLLFTQHHNDSFQPFDFKVLLLTFS